MEDNSDCQIYSYLKLSGKLISASAILQTDQQCAIVELLTTSEVQITPVKVISGLTYFDTSNTIC